MSEAGSESMDGLQTIGIINALKTGNVQIDLMIAMCIPLILRFVFNNLELITSNIFRKEFWIQWWVHQQGYKERLLVSKTVVSTDYWSGGHTSLDFDSQNAVLIKAIKLYIHSKVKLKMDSAFLDLTSTDGEANEDSGYWSDEDENEDKTLVGILSKYKLVSRPMPNIWHDLGYYGKNKPLQMVELQIRESKDTIGSQDNQKETNTITYHLRSLGTDGIDDFLSIAYNWYLDELRKLEDNSRYYYELQQVGSDDENGSAGYKRFKLADEKTFGSLFFRQKDAILRIVENFTNKTGKYAIKGYPHKLGIMLHGPPGTGKTSLIKALAHHTGRSIVNVSLSKISTNAELQSVFFDNRYYIQGESVPVKLGFKDVIFVFEDVDACSKVVHRRDGKKTADVVETECVEIPAAKSIWRLLIESSNDECRELVQDLMAKSERLKKEATRPEVLRSLASGMADHPGISLVGSSDSALRQIGEEAIEIVDGAMNGKETVDRFLSSHVKPLKALIEHGAEVNDTLVDELLRIPGTEGTFIPREASREIAYEIAETEKPQISVPGGESLLQPAFEAEGPIQGPSPKDEKKGDADGAKKWSGLMKKDGLTLAGLLNVLDGVVDTPGRMIVMTTNHPEMLDPALIRPGRIDKKILLSFMAAQDVVNMLQHYFQTELNNAQIMRVDEAINGNPAMHRPALKMTPAQIEQLAAEYDDLEDMIHALEEKGRPRFPPKPERSTGGRRSSSHTTISFGL